VKNREELLIRIIHFLAEKFKTEIALEGGMLLRLLGCPRSTQDVDYVLRSSQSKKVLAERLRRIFSQWDEIEIVAVKLNSRGVFLDVETTEKPFLKANIEIKVQAELGLPIESSSTAAVAREHKLDARVVSIVALAEAFSNKIAAALERTSARDLYDLSQFEPLSAYDVVTLRKRFSTLSVSRGKPRSITFQEASRMLRKRIEALTELDLERELYPLLPPAQRRGLLLIIKAAVARIAARLEVEE
jgi:predicted nucleotidyltransferase component of viral defense system